MKKGFIIAIDGPVASGKGTIAQVLSQTINALNFNSGGVYRAYARKLQDLGILSENEDAIKKHLNAGSVDIVVDPDASDGYSIILDGKDVTEHLFTPEISMAASNFGKSRAFVEFVSSELRRIAKNNEKMGKGIIMEGRQIGVDVFPDADIKIFLTADLNTRAKRRYEQYVNKNIEKSFDEVVQETHQRDEQDMNRTFGALPRHPEKRGYVIIDNTKLSEKETLDAILLVLIKNKLWTKN